jgi:hypothetical protein
LQSLARLRDPLRVIEPFLNPLLGKGNRLSGLIPRRKKPAPASDDLIVRPGSSDCGIEPQEHVQVIVHQRKTTEGHGKDFPEFLEAVLEPLLAVALFFAQ